jgi:aryl-alcohol dehydrogenase-like predicted oxidoreductase
MQKRKLGTSNLEVLTIGLGCMGLRRSRSRENETWEQQKIGRRAPAQFSTERIQHKSATAGRI